MRCRPTLIYDLTIPARSGPTPSQWPRTLTTLTTSRLDPSPSGRIPFFRNRILPFLAHASRLPSSFSTLLAAEPNFVPTLSHSQASLPRRCPPSLAPCTIACHAARLSNFCDRSLSLSPLPSARTPLSLPLFTLTMSNLDNDTLLGVSIPRLLSSGPYSPPRSSSLSPQASSASAVSSVSSSAAASLRCWREVAPAHCWLMVCSSSGTTRTTSSLSLVLPLPHISLKKPRRGEQRATSSGRRTVQDALNVGRYADAHATPRRQVSAHSSQS